MTECAIVEQDWEKIRDMLVGSMTNQGFRHFMVEDGDYQGNLELYLKHYYDGRPLIWPTPAGFWDTCSPSGAALSTWKRSSTTSRRS